MATTNTEFSYYYYIRKKGTQYYLGLVNDDGDAVASAQDIVIYYNEIPDDVDDQDDTLPIPIQFELGFLKGVAAEVMSMSGKDAYDVRLRNEYISEYNKTISDAIHYQIEEAGQPKVIRPLDLRDDDVWGR